MAIIQAQAAGISYGAKRPYTEIGTSEVRFAFIDALGKRYLVTGEKLTLEEAEFLIEQRAERFESEPGSRESFKDKVLRKYIAAQGQDFNSRLLRKLTGALKGEHRMMMKPDSHHSTAHKALFQEIRRDDSTLHLTAYSWGEVEGEQPQVLQDQTGRIFGGP